MPNIKSAKKRVLVTATKRSENKAVISALKSSMKKFKKVLATNIDEAVALIPETVSIIDKAGKKGVISAQAASRKQAFLYNEVSRAKVALEAKKQAEIEAQAQKEAAAKELEAAKQAQAEAVAETKKSSKKSK